MDVYIQVPKQLSEKVSGGIVMLGRYQSSRRINYA